MTLELSVSLLIALINISSLIIISHKRRKNQLLVFSMSLLNSGLAIWQILLILISSGLDTYVMHKMTFLAASWAVVGGYGLALSYPNRKTNRLERYIFFITSLINCTFSLLIVFSELVVSGYILETTQVTFGLWGYILLFFLSFLLLLIIRKLFVRYRTEINQRSYFRYVLLSFGVYGGLSLILNLILPILGITEYAAIGSLISTVPQLAVVYTLMAKRLHAIKYLFRKVLLFVFASIISYVAFFVFAGLFQLAWGDVFAVQALIAGIAMACLYTAIYALLYRLFQREIDRIFVGQSDLETVLEDFAKITSTELRLRELAITLLDSIKKAVNNDRLGVVIFDSERSDQMLFEYLPGLSINKATLIELLYSYDFKSGGVLIGSELRRTSVSSSQRLYNILERNNVSAVLPITNRGKLFGVCILGGSIEKVYSIEDVEFLVDVARRFSIAADRALLYKQVSDFNLTLQEAVENATEQLREANEELRELDQMKDDLISIASHELRTPAAIVKGKLYLLKGRVEKLKKCEEYDPKIEEDVDVCLSAIEREIEQVNTLLEASRVGKDTMKLEKQDYNIIEIVEQAVGDFQEMAKNKSLALELNRTTDDIPVLAIDVKRIREVLDNLITNAIKYSEKGGIKISVSFAKKEEEVLVSIKDTGIGIPEDELEHLFSKFYRVQNRKKGDMSLVKPGGTGLGLFVAKNIIEKHGGRIWVESRLGEGSTFTFAIPIE